jgi:hypothetical protein
VFRKYILLFAVLSLASPYVLAVVTIEESQTAILQTQGPTPGASKSIDPSSAEAPDNQRRPVGTAISGINNSTPISKQGTQGLSMKCWQDGKLIIDQPVKALPSDAKKGHAMTSSTTGTDVYAFDFRNAMCIVK